MLLLLGCRARAGVAGLAWGAGLRLSLHLQGELPASFLLLPRAHCREGSLILSMGLCSGASGQDPSTQHPTSGGV